MIAAKVIIAPRRWPTSGIQLKRAIIGLKSKK